jgi:hypothetical protein
MRFAVQRHRLPDYVRIPTQGPLPEPVTEYHNSLVAGLILLQQKCPAERRFDPEHLEEISRNPRGLHPLGFPQTGEIRCPAGVYADRLERSGQVAISLKAVGRDRRFQVQRWVLMVDRYQLAWALVRQGPQKERVDGAEDRGVRPDSQRDRKHDDGREPPVAVKGAQRVAKVVTELVHGRLSATGYRLRGRLNARWLS